jgi:hypothetical protein
MNVLSIKPRHDFISKEFSGFIVRCADLDSAYKMTSELINLGIAVFPKLDLGLDIPMKTVVQKKKHYEFIKYCEKHGLIIESGQKA